MLPRCVCNRRLPAPPAHACPRSGRAPSHLPTSGVLSKPFGGGGSGAPRGGGRAPMQLEAPHGASLAARFDTLSGAPTSGPTRATGQPRRNAHGVIIP